MSSAVASADTAAGPVLAARSSPDAAVLVVTLRGGHWPYSCGLACTVRALAPQLAAAGAEVVLLAAEAPETRRRVAAAWRLPFRWLPQAAVEPVARDLGAWDPASGRALDSVGLLGPDGRWMLRQDFEDPGGAGSLKAVLAALLDAGLPAVPLPAGSGGPPGEVVGGEFDSVVRTLRRALAAAERLAAGLPPSPAAERVERTRLRLAGYLRGVQDIA